MNHVIIYTLMGTQLYCHVITQTVIYFYNSNYYIWLFVIRSNT